MPQLYIAAIFAYGILYITLAFMQAVVLGSPIGMALSVLTAGLVYVFQAREMVVAGRGKAGGWMTAVGWVICIMAATAAGLAPYVLR